MWPNPQLPEDLITFTEEFLNGKLHFLCSVLLCHYHSFLDHLNLSRVSGINFSDCYSIFHFRLVLSSTERKILSFSLNFFVELLEEETLGTLSLAFWSASWMFFWFNEQARLLTNRLGNLKCCFKRI